MIKEMQLQVILMAKTHIMFLLDLFLSLHFKVNVLIPGGQDVWRPRCPYCGGVRQTR